MSHFRKFLRITGLFTLSCFLLQQTAQGAESLPKPVHSPQIEVPADLGTLDKILSTDSGKKIFHIQDAHGSEDAQQNIRLLLKHITGQYGVKSVALEGGSGKLQPEQLVFLPDQPGQNIKIAEALLKKAELSGAELFLLEDLQSTEAGKINAYGVENIPDYRDNRLAFQEVLRAKNKTDLFLAQMDEQIKRLATPLLNENLRGFLKKEEDYQGGFLSFSSWLEFLQKEAGKNLSLDLENAFSQRSWPMLARFFRLQKNSQEIVSSSVTGEKDAFIKMLRGSNIEKQLLEKTVTLLDQNGTSAAGDFSQFPYDEGLQILGQLLEKLPEDFTFKPYRNLQLSLQSRILQSELNAGELYQEMQKLETLLLNQLTRTEEEKKLVALYKNYLELKKLFRLEITHSEYEEILKEKSSFKPGAMILAFEKLSSSPETRPVSFEHAEEIHRLFELALEFYSGAVRRDQSMGENILKLLDKTAEDLVLITGGFHSKGLEDFFKQEGINYYQISPRIQNLVSTKTYQAAMLEENMPESKKSTPAQTPIPSSNIAKILKINLPRTMAELAGDKLYPNRVRQLIRYEIAGLKLPRQKSEFQDLQSTTRANTRDKFSVKDETLSFSRSEFRVTKERMDSFFKKLEETFEKLPGDFKKQSFDYSFIAEGAVEEHLGQGMELVMDIFRGRGFMVNQETETRTTYWIDPDSDTFTFAELLELIKRKIQVVEGIYEDQDLDEAIGVILESQGVRHKKTPVVTLDGLLAWQELTAFANQLDAESRSEARGVRQILTRIGLSVAVALVMSLGSEIAAQVKTRLNPANDPIVQISKKAMPSVALISIGEGKQKNTGSGAVIYSDPKTYTLIITNSHVVQKAKKVTVSFKDGTVYEGEVVRNEPLKDLAAVSIKTGKQFPALPFQQRPLFPGQTVVALGHPFGYSFTTSAGIVSGKGRDITLPDNTTLKGLLQTDAPINPGNSGGPLLNINGELVGINSAVRTGAQNIAFTISADEASRFVTGLLPVSPPSQTAKQDAQSEIYDALVEKIKKADTSVVSIHTPRYGKKDLIGTGFILNSNEKESFIITPAHMLKNLGKNAPKILASDGTVYNGEIIKSDEKLDLALLKILPGKRLSVLEIEDLPPSAGTSFFAIGSPYGYLSSVATGRVSHTSRDVGGLMKFQLDFGVNPGDSGSPLIESQTGKVLGMISAQYDGAARLGFAIPAEAVKKFANTGSLTSQAPSSTSGGKETPGKIDPVVNVVKEVHSGAVTLRVPREGKRDNVGGGAAIHTGSGKAVIATTAHLLGEAKTFKITLSNGETLPGKTLKTYPERDLAFVEVALNPKSQIKPLVFSNTAPLDGETIFAIGAPYEFENTVSAGIKSADRMIGSQFFYQTTVAINPGNSGSPLFNLNGELVGLNTYYYDGATGMAFAIPTKEVKALYDRDFSKQSSTPVFNFNILPFAPEPRLRAPAPVIITPSTPGGIRIADPQTAAPRSELRSEEDYASATAHSLGSAQTLLSQAKVTATKEQLKIIETASEKIRVAHEIFFRATYISNYSDGEINKKLRSIEEAESLLISLKKQKTNWIWSTISFILWILSWIWPENPQSSENPGEALEKIDAALVKLADAQVYIDILFSFRSEVRGEPLPENWTYRQIIPEDQPAKEALFKRYFDHGTPRKSFFELKWKLFSRALLDENGNLSAAYEVYTNPKSLLIDGKDFKALALKGYFAVDPSLRGQKIGSRFFERIKQEFRSQGYNFLIGESILAEREPFWAQLGGEPPPESQTYKYKVGKSNYVRLIFDLRNIDPVSLSEVRTKISKDDARHPSWQEKMAEEDLKAAPEVLKAYSIGKIKSIAPLQAGIGEHGKALKVESNRGTYILKPITTALYPDIVDGARYEVSVVNELIRLRFPTAPLVPTRKSNPQTPEDRFFVEAPNGKIYLLYQFVGGENISSESMSTFRFNSFIDALATFHKTLSGFSPAGKRSRPSIIGFNSQKERMKQLKVLLEKKKEDNPKYIYSRGEKFFLNHADFILEQLSVLNLNLPPPGYERLPQTIIHGDYHPGNILFRDSQVTAVLDWDHLRREARIYDLLNGAIPNITSDNRFNTSELARAVTRYEITQTLTPDEKKFLPEIARLKFLDLATWIVSPEKISERHQYDLSTTPPLQQVIAILDKNNHVYEWFQKNMAVLKDIDLQISQGNFLRSEIQATLGDSLMDYMTKEELDEFGRLEDFIREDTAIGALYDALKTFQQELFKTRNPKASWTIAHAMRTSIIALRVGRQMKLPEHELRALAFGMVIHDIGKVLTPQEILNKEWKLDGEEFLVIKQHVIFGAKIFDEILEGLSTHVNNKATDPEIDIFEFQKNPLQEKMLLHEDIVDFLTSSNIKKANLIKKALSEKEFLRDLKKIIYLHHETANGTGYFGLINREIIVQIALLADILDAITAKRPYKPAQPIATAAAIFWDGRGTKFLDAVVAALFQAYGLTLPANDDTPSRSEVRSVPIRKEIEEFLGDKLSSDPPEKEHQLNQILEQLTRIAEKRNLKNGDFEQAFKKAGIRNIPGNLIQTWRSKLKPEAPPPPKPNERVTGQEHKIPSAIPQPDLLTGEILTLGPKLKPDSPLAQKLPPFPFSGKNFSNDLEGILDAIDVTISWLKEQGYPHPEILDYYMEYLKKYADPMPPQLTGRGTVMAKEVHKEDLLVTIDIPHLTPFIQALTNYAQPDAIPVFMEIFAAPIAREAWGTWALHTHKKKINGLIDFQNITFRDAYRTTPRTARNSWPTPETNKLITDWDQGLTDLLIFRLANESFENIQEKRFLAWAQNAGLYSPAAANRFLEKIQNPLLAWSVKDARGRIQSESLEKSLIIMMPPVLLGAFLIESTGNPLSMSDIVSKFTIFREFKEGRLNSLSVKAYIESRKSPAFSGLTPTPDFSKTAAFFLPEIVKHLKPILEAASASEVSMPPFPTLPKKIIKLQPAQLTAGELILHTNHFLLELAQEGIIPRGIIASPSVGGQVTFMLGQKELFRIEQNKVLTKETLKEAFTQKLPRSEVRTAPAPLELKLPEASKVRAALNTELSGVRGLFNHVGILEDENDKTISVYHLEGFSVNTIVKVKTKGNRVTQLTAAPIRLVPNFKDNRPQKANRELFRIFLKTFKESGFETVDLEYKERYEPQLQEVLQNLLLTGGIPKDQLSKFILRGEAAFLQNYPDKFGFTLPLNTINLDQPLVTRSEIRAEFAYTQEALTNVVQGKNWGVSVLERFATPDTEGKPKPSAFYSLGSLIFLDSSSQARTNLTNTQDRFLELPFAHKFFRTPAEGLHLTLFPIGEIKPRKTPFTPEETGEARKLFLEKAKNIPPFELKIEGIVSDPDSGRIQAEVSLPSSVAGNRQRAVITLFTPYQALTESEKVDLSAWIESHKQDIFGQLVVENIHFVYAKDSFAINRESEIFPLRSEVRTGMNLTSTQATLIARILLDGILPKNINAKIFASVFAFLFSTQIAQANTAASTAPLEFAEQKIVEAANAESVSSAALQSLLTADPSFALVGVPVPANLPAAELKNMLEELKPFLALHPKKLLALTYAGSLTSQEIEEIYQGSEQRVIIFQGSGEIFTDFYAGRFSKLGVENSKTAKRVLERARELTQSSATVVSLAPVSVVISNQGTFDTNLSLIGKQFVNTPVDGLSLTQRFMADVLYSVKAAGIKAEKLTQDLNELTVLSLGTSVRFEFNESLSGRIAVLVQAALRVLSAA